MMMRRLVLTCIAFAALVCLDVGIPLTMLVGRAAILRNGTEVRLALTTQDPRDLFRGEYSRLAYAIGTLSSLPAADEERARCAGAATDCEAQNGRPLFVTLTPEDNGTYRAVAASLTESAAGTLFIRGKIEYGSYQTAADPVKCPSGRCFNGRVTYGIESWFGPQGLPAQVDRTARNQVVAVVRVDRSGTAVLADLLIGGKPVGTH
jgi:uncharacterized membrane-anchored protein